MRHFTSFIPLMVGSSIGHVSGGSNDRRQAESGCSMFRSLTIRAAHVKQLAIEVRAEWRVVFDRS
jgi:hypothetical protein